ncbi:MAG TPA: hypothetical protein VNT55_07520 [Baekduia sp.]|nr:hypothetical protein [Baekduia sp.]
MTARLVTILATLALVLVGGAATATAGAWHSEQPLTTGSDVPVPLGQVYDIKFWAPNRGLLITADGLWAYDGTGWHRLSTVCGGTNGRIAWAGPLDFWTVSDQPVGQPAPAGASRAARSLCHFVNGTVVASYAQPIGQAGSYLPMTGAACVAPDDCWFGGARLPGTANTGAFHLHWDGTAVTPWPSLLVRDPSLNDPDRAVADLAVHQGALYESVSVEGDVPNEPNDQPFLLHEIFSGSPPAFSPLFPSQRIEYGGAAPSSLGGLLLSSDGDTLWAVAGAADPSSRPAPPVVLRLGPDGLAPVTLNDPDRVLQSDGLITAMAAEPGTGSAWVGYVPSAEQVYGRPLPARLVRVHAGGTVDDATTLPSDADGIARKQSADRLACPAPGQCWMATQTGWLFHLGDSLPRDDEPAMHRLITYRPPDGATLSLPPDSLPDDDSGIAPPVFDEPPPIGYTPPTETTTKAKRKKLVTNMAKPKVRGLTLELRFTLTAKAHVQLLAKRKKSVVAKTKRRTLAKGRVVLRLKLSRKRWPTALDLRATPVKTSGSSTPQAGDGVDNAEADDNLSSGTVTISSIRRITK